jgi:hypothetical protein
MFPGAYRRLFPVDAFQARGQGSARKGRRMAAPLCDLAKSSVASGGGAGVDTGGNFEWSRLR